MNFFTLEQKFDIQNAIMYFFIVFAVVTLVMSIRAFRHRHEEKNDDPYNDQMPTWSLWISGTIIGVIVSVAIYLNIYTNTGIVDYTYCLAKRRQSLVYGSCEKIQNLGCPEMWKQFREDSLWIEKMLDKYRE